MRTLMAAATVGTAGTTIFGLTTAPAQAHQRTPHPSPVTIASGLISPLSLAVDGRGTIYTTQNFAGQLTKISHGKTSTVFATSDGSEVGGVSVSGSSITFTITGPKTTVNRIDSRGHVRTLADVGAYEAKVNPDRRVTYGIKHLAPSCAAQFPAEVPASYTGLVDSHPYATTIYRGDTYVADAAGNDILRIEQRGRIHTVAVLPALASVITAEAAAANGIPSCAVGKTYLFEPVPTDVEVGPGGWLYVSSLPGGPEDASLGARGSVFKVNPRNGHVVQVAKGLLGATNLAVTPRGDIYATELFGNRISYIARGSHTPKPFLNTLMPGAAEWTPRGLYATNQVLVGTDPGSAPGGQVIKIALPHGWCR